MRDEVGSHFLEEAVVAALVEEIEILFAEKLRAGDGGFRAHALAGMQARLSLQKIRSNKHRDVVQQRPRHILPSSLRMYIFVYSMYIRWYPVEERHFGWLLPEIGRTSIFNWTR